MIREMGREMVMMMVTLGREMERKNGTIADRQFASRERKSCFAFVKKLLVYVTNVFLIFHSPTF